MSLNARDGEAMKALAKTVLDVQPLARLFRALSDETRVRIVALLTHGELCVCHIESALELAQPTASRQIGVLRSAGVVVPRREGSWIYYRLAEQPEEECRLVLAAIEAFAARAALRKDLVRLRKLKGPEAACR
jgi:ArsR family transcriptional regulator